jgi:hypothetical protein
MAAAVIAAFTALVVAAAIVSASAVVAATASARMHMAVMKFFFGSVANPNNLDIEVEILSGQGMIGVYRDLVSRDVNNRDYLGAVFAMGFELHSRGYFRLIAKILARNLEYEAFIPFSVGFRRRHYAIHRVTGLLSFKVLFQAWNYVVVPMKVDEGLALIG